jgi:hypothetical protein
VIDCVISPVLQILPVGSLEVNTILSPGQRVVDPLVEIVGTERVVVVVTVIPVDTAEHPTELKVTE